MAKLDDKLAPNCGLLSAEQLTQQGWHRDPSLPVRGVKDYAPSGGWMEQKALGVTFRERARLMAEERVAKLGSLARGEWKPDLKKVHLVKNKKKFWQTMGYSEDGMDFLHPEEALFLLDAGMMELYYCGLPLSLQQAYATLLHCDLTMEQYQVFALLNRYGYILRRHNPDMNVTAYEHQLRLDQYLKSSRKVKKRRHPKPRSEGGGDGAEDMDVTAKVSKIDDCDLEHTESVDEVRVNPMAGDCADGVEVADVLLTPSAHDCLEAGDTEHCTPTQVTMSETAMKSSQLTTKPELVLSTPEHPAETTPHTKDPELSLNTTPHTKDPELSLNTTPHTKDPELSLNTTLHTKDPELSLNTTPHTKDPELSLNTTPHTKDPELSLNTTPHTKDPELSLNTTPHTKDPELSLNTTPPTKDPELSLNTTPHTKDPELSLNTTLHTKDPELSLNTTPHTKDPELSLNTTPLTKDPELSLNTTPHTKDPELSLNTTPHTKDPELSLNTTPLTKDPELALNTTPHAKSKDPESGMETAEGNSSRELEAETLHQAGSASPTASDEAELRPTSSVPYTKWDWVKVTLPNIANKSRLVLRRPSPDLLPCCVLYEQDAYTFDVPSFARGRRPEKSWEFSLGGTSWKRNIQASNWGDYRKAHRKYVAEYSLGTSPAGHLWRGVVKPLVKPQDAVSGASILQRLQIIENVQLSLPPPVSEGGSVDRNVSVRIMFDVYLPNSRFKKTSVTPPNHHLCVVRWEDGLPSVGQRLDLTRRRCPQVPLHFAIVDGGDVNFYVFHDVTLPTDSRRK